MSHGYPALLGALIGFLAAFVPELMGMVKDHYQHRREMQERDKELEAAAQGYHFAVETQRDVIAAQAAQIEKLSMMQQDMVNGGSNGLQILRMSVRPVLTYGFFWLFAFIKLYSMWQGYHYEQTSVSTLFPVIWDDDTESLFAAIISFWFGSRTTAIPSSVNAPKSKGLNNLPGRNPGGQVVAGDE